MKQRAREIDQLVLQAISRASQKELLEWRRRKTPEEQQWIAQGDVPYPWLTTTLAAQLFPDRSYPEPWLRPAVHRAVQRLANRGALIVEARYSTDPRNRQYYRQTQWLRIPQKLSDSATS